MNRDYRHIRHVNVALHQKNIAVTRSRQACDQNASTFAAKYKQLLYVASGIISTSAPDNEQSL